MTADTRNLQKTAGYLEKRGKLKFMNSWKKYWFVLEGHLLLYYGSKDDYDTLSPCKGSITLGHASTVVLYSPVPLGFQITTRSTTITLRAESVSEQTKWMQAFLSALNPNQNINSSPTKLNHFRYSSENLNILAENREDIHGTPSSSPQGKSPQDTPKMRESPLIDRLQKLGAKSYGNNASVQHQILEGVKYSRQRSFVKETVAEHSRSDSNGSQVNELKNVQSSPTRKISQESRDGTRRKEEVILEDEDFCVCTLETRDKDKLRTLREEETVEIEFDEEDDIHDCTQDIREIDKLKTSRDKETVDTESEKSFSFKANMLKQQLNSELNKRRNANDTKPPLKTKPSFDSESDNMAVNKQSHLNKLFHSESIKNDYTKNKNYVQNNQHEEADKELLINNENKNESSEMIKQHEPQVQTKPRIYENTDISKEFYLHRTPNTESFQENSETLKPIQTTKPIRKLKNIQNSFSESEDKFSKNRNIDCNKKQNIKNIENVYPEPKHEGSMNNKDFNKATNQSHILKENDNETSKTKSDVEYHLYAEPNEITTINNNCNASPTTIERTVEQTRDKRVLIKPPKPHLNTNETPGRSHSEIAAPVYTEPNKEKKLKNMEKLNTYPRDESLVKSSCKGPVPTYAQPNKELKLKNILNLNTDPRDETSRSREKDGQMAKSTLNNPHSNLKFHLHNKLTDELCSDNIGRVTPALHKEQTWNNIENIYAEPEDVPLKSNESKIKQQWTDHNIKPVTISKEINKFHSSVKPKGEHSDNTVPIYTEPIKKKKLKNIRTSDYHMTDNVLYASPNNDLNKTVNLGENLFLGGRESSKTEELQCEMDFNDEAMDEFECDNDLYGSPVKLLNTSPVTPKEIHKGPNEDLPRNWKRQFQFPPPPTDDAHIYAEVSSSVGENKKGPCGKLNDDVFEIQQAEFQLENELYAETTVGKNNYEYPEYEEPEVICDNDIYAQSNSEILKTRVLGKPEEVEYTSIPEIDENTGHYYSQIFKTNDYANLYEDPDKCQVEKTETKDEIVKPKKKNTRQRSEPFGKSSRIDDSKKGDHFIQKIFKPAARKNCDKSNKCEPLLDRNMDEIQQLLEIKKKMIQAMAVQGRQLEATRTHWKSKSMDSDIKVRAKSYPSRSPDLLKDLKSGSRGLEENYSTVRDNIYVKIFHENIYNEVLPDPNNFDEKQRRPSGVGKFNTWAHAKKDGND